jgi:type VI secretion system secreted protein VgrG
VSVGGRRADVAVSLGQTQIRLGKLREGAQHLAYAVRHWQVTAKQGPREAAVKRLEEVRKELAVATVKVSVAGAEVLVDGQRIGTSPIEYEVFLDPGTRTIEVIVEFLDGDPDRPIVTGRVYNGQNRPPGPASGAATVSLFKSLSSPGAGVHNELGFDDTAGKEQIQLHAGKDWNSTIGHDRSEKVANHSISDVGVDRTESTGGNRATSVKVDNSESVNGNEHITIGVNQTTSVGADQRLSVTANRAITVGSNQTAGIGANRSTTVGADDNLAVGANRAVHVGANLRESLLAAAAAVLQGANVSITGAGEITLSAGGGAIKIGGGGVEITGGSIKLAGGSVDVTGSPVKLN